MDFFGLKKRKDFVDLTKTNGNEGSNLDLSIEPEIDVSDSEPQTPEEKRKRLIKRLTDMTEKLEDVSNQIYLLQQRIEVLEKRLNVQVE
tara:strand:+ start:725 stop:991 length:267 start_codon:yes stop_codon:yes gene_type:complete